MIAVDSICRLLVEDPEGWTRVYFYEVPMLDGRIRHERYGDVYHLRHLTGHEVILYGSGTMQVSGLPVGAWGRYLIRRALEKHRGILVDVYLTRKRNDRLEAELEGLDRELNLLGSAP